MVVVVDGVVDGVLTLKGPMTYDSIQGNFSPSLQVSSRGLGQALGGLSQALGGLMQAMGTLWGPF